MNEPKLKAKGLFDHLKEITQIQRTDYWENLSESDRKSWSTFMVNRFLSMNYDWVETINELQRYTLDLEPKIVYRLYIEVFPKSRIFLQYIKSKNEVKYSKELIELFMKHFEVSEREVRDYLAILFSKKDGVEEVEKIVAMYGKDEKEVKKIVKIL